MLFYRNMAVHVEAVQVQLTNQKSWEKGDRGRAQRCDFCSVSLLPFLPPHPEASMVMLNCLNRETLFFGPFHSSVPLFASSQPFALFQPLSPTSQPITPPKRFLFPRESSWFLSFARPHPLCVTGLPFLIADPSLCYYSGPPLYDMFLFYGAYKGSIWSEGYGARVAEMQLHGGNLCLGWQWWVDLISSKAKGPSYSKAQSHLLSTFNRDRPVTDIASQLSEAQASFSGSSTAGPKT